MANFGRFSTFSPLIEGSDKVFPTLLLKDRAWQGTTQKQQFEFYKALKNFNAAIFKSPLVTELLAEVYGNRSAVYFATEDYAECLENIKLARAHAFPIEHMPQLDYLEQQCKKLIVKRKWKFDPWKFFKLSRPANEKIPFIIKGLELCEDEKYGRYIITTSDLKPGDIIAIEEPIIKLSFHDDRNAERCWICLKSNKLNLIPGNLKPEAEVMLFCSRGCQEEYKKQKCYQELLKEFNGNMYHLHMLLVTIRIAGGVDELASLFSDGKPKTVFDFDFSNPNDPSNKKNLLAAACASWGHGIEFTKAEERFSAEEEKAFLSSMIDRLKEGFFFSNAHELEKFSYSSWKVQCYGFGISSFSSLINHSCYPNVKFISFDNKIAIVVARPIQAGEQIFTSYDSIRSSLTSLKGRKKQLADYRFECNCIACVEKYPICELPEFKAVSPGNAIRMFKENCNYIEKNIDRQPCREISCWIEHNYHLLHCLAAPENQFNHVKEKFH